MVSAMQNIKPDQALKNSRAIAMPKRMLVSFSRRGGSSGCSPRCCLRNALARIQTSSGSTATSKSWSVHGQ